MELRSYSSVTPESDSTFEVLPSSRLSFNMTKHSKGLSNSDNNVDYSNSHTGNVDVRNVRARVVFSPLPHDATTTILRNFKMMSIADLTVEKHTVEEMIGMKKSYLALQLLRIVCGNNVNDKSAGV